MPGKKRVVLFKKQDTDDKYQQLLLENGFETDFMPVLDHKLVNIDIIKSIIQNGPSREQLCAMVLTSQRSVEAIDEACRELTSLDQHVRKEWNSIPIYVVGPQTAEALVQLPLFRDFSSHDHWIVAPRASELIKSFSPQHLDSTVLFLAGDKRREVIPEALSAAHIALREIQSYVTCAHPDLENRIRQDDNLLQADWAVYFSPSGLKFLVNQLGNRAHLLANTKIASIGPTTSDYITNQLKLNVNAEAEKPDAEHLKGSLNKRIQVAMASNVFQSYFNVAASASVSTNASTSDGSNTTTNMSTV
ncbi:tetrapyrrole biosynthesis, uroporphyrinogen III synthase [Parasitella parasitica]|nr:tetrapyrrole biosynthesis, uroporphyrinogen III synthase [Parasitella parasitica]